MARNVWIFASNDNSLGAEPLRLSDLSHKLALTSLNEGDPGVGGFVGAA